MKKLLLLLLLLFPFSGFTYDIRSITGPDYKGHKYYVGFGDRLSGMMGNEVKYDVKHTNDLFTSGMGGDYIGVTAIGSLSQLKNYWNDIAHKITGDDMYVQYSSGHGSQDGLMFGVSYTDIRDYALSLPAKEIVIYTMSCYSGNLVDAFNDRKDVWGNWQTQGRTLYVMASSRDDQESSTGPGTDPEEHGPNGSAGSAFGHALWKALIGHADSNHDGLLTVQEIQDYVIRDTQEEGGGQTPVVTGVYDPNLIMAKVPPKAWVEKIERNDDGLTDEQILRRVQELNKLN